MAPDAATLVREDRPAVTPPPPAEPPPPPPPPEPVLAERRGALSRNWALVLGLGWPAAVVISRAIQPAPANPEAALPLWAAVIELILTAGLLATVATAAGRRPQAAMFSAGLGVATLGLVVACPASGHHGFGAWWFAELALYGGLFAASMAALRSLRH